MKKILVPFLCLVLGYILGNVSMYYSIDTKVVEIKKIAQILIDNIDQKKLLSTRFEVGKSFHTIKYLIDFKEENSDLISAISKQLADAEFALVTLQRYGYDTENKCEQNKVEIESFISSSNDEIETLKRACP